MGVVKTIDHDRKPKQGAYLNRKVSVCFNYDTSKAIGGVVVRDDAEEPGIMLIKLDDGFYVRSTECQWRPL